MWVETKSCKKMVTSSSTFISLLPRHFHVDRENSHGSLRISRHCLMSLNNTTSVRFSNMTSEELPPTKKFWRAFLPLQVFSCRSVYPAGSWGFFLRLPGGRGKLYYWKPKEYCGLKISMSKLNIISFHSGLTPAS